MSDDAIVSKERFLNIEQFKEKLKPSKKESELYKPPLREQPKPEPSLPQPKPQPKPEPKGEGLSTIFLPESIPKLFSRLNILLTARSEGLNSKESFNEIHAILKRLFEKKAITKKDYKFLAP